MMQNLEDICFQKFTNTIYTMPPLLQEHVIGTSTEKLKKEVKKEVKEEVVLEVSENFAFLLPNIVPEIIRDIITSNSNNNTFRINFFEKYSHIDKNIISCAIKTAEYSVMLLQENYNFYTYENNLENIISDDDFDY